MNTSTGFTFAGSNFRRFRTRSRTAAATLLAAMLAAATAHAASDTWVGTTDTTWATSTNWLSGNVPGTFSGNVSFAGGSLAPGNSPGTITINGDFSASSASIIAMELVAVTSDLIKVGGQFTATHFTLNVTNLDNALTTGSSFSLFQNLSGGPLGDQ